MKKYIKLLLITLSISILGLSFTACTRENTNLSDNSKTSTLNIGVIQFANHPSLDNCYDGIEKSLKESGALPEGSKIDLQNAMGQPETADQIAKNMVAKDYDLIIGIATPAAISTFSAARGTDIPVVFCAVSDPVSAKLVESLENPGGNCTGTSDLLNLEAQMKLIRAMQPKATKIGVLYTTREANSVSHLAEFTKLAPKYGFEIISEGIQNAADIPQAAASLVTKVDCINNFTDNTVVENLGILLSQAKQAGIPVYGSEIEQVKNGCIASESLDYVTLGEQTGKIAIRILSGEKVDTIPVVRVKESKPVFNTEVIKTLGISLPTEYKDAEQIKAD